MRALVLCVSALRCATALTWTRHTLPLSGELVLTDVHAVYDAVSDTVTALATGEAGVVLKLHAPAGAAGGQWTTLLDTAFPTYWYGCYAFSETSFMLSGFIDGAGAAYGIVAFSTDGGHSWTNDTRVDVSAWAGGPIEFANATEEYMPSTSGASAWRTSNGGRRAADWVEITPSPANWHAGNYVYDGAGEIAIAGSSDCTSLDYGESWACTAPVDASGIDSALACAGTLCVLGGGEISPAVLGWAHVSHDAGASWPGARALVAAYPIRTTVAVTPTLVAAGGDFFSGVGGIYVSGDGGATWAADLDLAEEVKACRALVLPAPRSVTRVYCVSAGSSGGSIVSADIIAA